MKGMKQNKAPTTKDRIRELEAAMQNTQMALQMSQMMIKHITDQCTAMKNDLGSTMGMVNDFQYRTLAMLELGTVSKDDIDKKAEELKLIDFTSASDKEDLEKGYLDDVDGIITEESVVVLCSSTPDLDDDQGIFRSKFPMSDCFTPDLKEKLIGAKVGDFLETEVQGVNHKIEVLGLRKLPEVVEAELVDRDVQEPSEG